MDEIKQYKTDGFSGFIKVSSLRSATHLIPAESGVYVVLSSTLGQHECLERGTGGHFKQQDPNVSIPTLERKLVEESATMYIGKSINLRKRLRKLMRFRNGATDSHWGGRYLWQLSDAEDLLIAWKLTPGTDPEQVKEKMLADYKKRFGKLPFANIKGYGKKTR